MMSELTGKPLGIAVAKQVMGWTEVRMSDALSSPDDAYPVFYAFEDQLFVYASKEYGSTKWARRWAPWRDMNDAMEVNKLYWVWAMREYLMEVSARLTVIHPEGTYCATVELDKDLSRKEAWCHARLRAALAAVEQKGGQQ